jgi:hypothetical protein
MTPRLSLEQLVEGSDRIVQGRCLRSWSAWDANHQFIWTHHEIQIADSLKGDAASTMVVSEPGGVVDGMELAIEGMPRYRTGDEMVLFLYKTPIGFWRARGLDQGKYLVVEDAAAGRRIRAGTPGAVLVEPTGVPLRGADLRQLDGMGLEDFKSRIRALRTRSGKGAK